MRECPQRAFTTHGKHWKVACNVSSLSKLKRLIPAGPKRVMRSVRIARGLGLLSDYLSTARNSRGAIRLGTDYGGWVIPSNLLKSDAICYCVGCGEDISFDLALIERYSCEVWGFDPTPRAVQYVKRVTESIPRYHFEPVAVWNEEGSVNFYLPSNSGFVSHSITNLHEADKFIEVPSKRLSSILQTHHHDRLTLLKLDIEGAERIVIDTILEDHVDVDILLVEFDELARPTSTRFRMVRESIEKLRDAGLRLFWIEGLNFTFVRQ